MSGPTPGPGLDLLLRRGGDERAAGKKVLLAWLASEEARRLGLGPGAEETDRLVRTLRRELDLEPDAAFDAWLAEAGLSRRELDSAMAGFAAVLAVEAHHADHLSHPLEVHRRLMNARERRLASRRSSG